MIDLITEEYIEKRGNSMKKEKMIAFSFSLFLGIITWFTLATSVRKGLPLLDASIFEYFGYAMSHGQRMYL